MAEPLSIASGVAGLIALSSAVVAAGYKYFSSVRSAPEELKELVRVITLLHTLVSQLVAQSLSARHRPHSTLVALADQDTFQDCYQTLKSVQSISITASLSMVATGKTLLEYYYGHSNEKILSKAESALVGYALLLLRPTRLIMRLL
jgi:hypothetical protein